MCGPVNSFLTDCEPVLTLADARRNEQCWLALRLDLRLCYGPITEFDNQVTQLSNSGLYRRTWSLNDYRLKAGRIQND